MSDPHTASTQSPELLVPLPKLGSGDASSMLVALAQETGYSLAAMAPGTFRLARTRRRLVVSKRTETATVAIFEDRSGTKARVVGTLDPSLLAHLAAAGNPAQSERVPPAPSGTIVSPSPIPAAEPAAPAPQSIPVAPLPQVGGSAVSPAPTPAASSPRPVPAQHSTGAIPPQPTWPPSDPTSAGGVDGATVARTDIGRTDVPFVVLPDGRNIDLTTPLLIGRNPDPSRAADARGVVIEDRSMSKTHLLIGCVGGAVSVTDLHSTNGTSFHTAAATIHCVAGVASALPDGASIVAGDVPITVRR